MRTTHPNHVVHTDPLRPAQGCLSLRTHDGRCTSVSLYYIVSKSSLPVQGNSSLEAAWPTRVSVLIDRAIDLADEHDSDSVLQRIVESAAAVAGAHYSALGVYDEAGALTTFVDHGMDPAIVERIGELPQGRGLLGQLIMSAGPIRLGGVAGDSRSCGFPAHHPPMHSFLGVPVTRGGRRYGNLYVAEKLGGSPFDSEDEALIVVLAPSPRARSRAQC